MGGYLTVRRKNQSSKGRTWYEVSCAVAARISGARVGAYNEIFSRKGFLLQYSIPQGSVGFDAFL